jgi:hypothetical protein
MAFGRKSRWEIHREDMARHSAEADARDDKFRDEMKTRDEEYRAEMKERDAKRDEEAQKHQEKMERFSEEAREERAASEARWLRLSEKYDRELAETRRFNAQMLTRLEKTYAGLDRSLKLMGEQLESNTEEVRAQTKAIFSLLDYFKGTNGGPPV